MLRNKAEDVRCDVPVDEELTRARGLKACVTTRLKTRVYETVATLGEEAARSAVVYV